MDERAVVVEWLGSSFVITAGGEQMKYVFLFCGTAADQAAFDALTPDELRERYAQVGRWFAEHHGRLGHGNQLQGPETATTVSFQGGRPIVKDGPFIEGKELVGRVHRGRGRRPGRGPGHGKVVAG